MTVSFVWTPGLAKSCGKKKESKSCTCLEWPKGNLLLASTRPRLGRREPGLLSQEQALTFIAGFSRRTAAACFPMEEDFWPGTGCSGRPCAIPIADCKKTC